MKSVADIDEKFGLAPRAEDQRKFRRGAIVGYLATVRRVRLRGHIKRDRICAQARLTAQPVAPDRGVLDVQRGFGFVDAIIADGRKRHTRLRIQQRHVDHIVAQLRADFRNRFVAEQ